MSKHLFPKVRVPIEPDNVAIMRVEEKCIQCGSCKSVCKFDIGIFGSYKLEETNDIGICVNCGQCVNVCPADALREVEDWQKVKKIIADGEKTVLFMTSPGVRVSLGEAFDLEPGTNVEGKLAASIRKLGANYVFDTTFGADLTIMEEASELVTRITTKNKPLPQFTSCCPAWVSFCEMYYPEMLPHLSSAKSPTLMQGPTIKTYFAKKAGLDPEKMVVVAVTPCTAKKFEITRPEMNDAGKYYGKPEIRDVDYVLTIRELAKWIKDAGIDFETLADGDYDKLLGRGSGAGVIFGNTGGVMEAAARTAYNLVTKENPPQEWLHLEPVRGMDGVKKATVDINGIAVRVAVIHGLKQVRKVIEAIKDGSLEVDFVEVMTCRGGCIGGGGQPKTEIPLPDEIREARIASLYAEDEALSVRFSHENPEIKTVYQEFYGAPLTELAEDLLHTSYTDQSAKLGKK
ncbi:MAG: [FeFe] hydrogenase, group A [Acidaminococcaceae bacterium]